MPPRSSAPALTLSRVLSFLLVLLACAPSARAQPAPAPAPALPPPVAAALARADIPESAVGIFVQDVASTRPSLAINAGQPMNPASTMKLVTTFAALELLGPAYAWRTEAYATGPVRDGVLEGDLVLKGYGDPRLALEDFWLLQRALRQRGVRDIRGDLVLDRSWFEPGDVDPGRFDGEPLRAYNVAPDALLVNFKTVRFLFLPEPERAAVRIVPEPRLPQVDVVNNMRLAQGACGDWRASVKLDVQEAVPPAPLRVSFTGTMPAACGERAWNVSLLGHAAYAGGLFRSLWEESGGTLRGGIREGPVPADARLLYTHESPSLAEVVRDVNKFSNNVMSRQVFLTLSAEILKLPARADRSTRVVQSWLGAQGLAMPELVLENGSGLSRVERISAASLGRLLVAAFRSPVMPELVSSLPLAGYDGTLRKQPRIDATAGRAHLKTGSLAEVRSIAGYVLDRKGRRQALVFIVNHPNAAQAEAAMSALVRWVYGERRERVEP
jgi:D-alanyl-D-alanine carboxypeptidase/D-alanyl-D-alanine-endopeptidase (penicillin-binding protein 4)